MIEVDERIITSLEEKGGSTSTEEITGINGKNYLIDQPLNEGKIEQDLLDLYNNSDIRSLAVVCVHSYSVPLHEEKIEKIARKIGFTNISLSSKIMPMIKMVPRGLTCCVDAYLTPCIRKYLDNFCKGFINLAPEKVNFMQSDGGLTGIQSFTGSRAILSGPAGGVVGYALTTKLDQVSSEINCESEIKCESDQNKNLPVIGFDMGGTSTDVSRYAGKFEHIFETTISGTTIQAPQLDINTVAAGGGSRLFYRAGLLVVGPESSGSEPGPICYRKPGGLLAVTDVNVALGRVLPEHFPKIFGPKKNQSLDAEASQKAIEKINDTICSDLKKEYSWEETAVGFIDVANETMCRPIRAITQAKGYDTSKHILATFGGAGGQHCCAIARSLGMRQVYVHKYAGILSAYGMALADVVHEEQEPTTAIYETDLKTSILPRARIIAENCRKNLENSGQEFKKISVELFLNMRFEKTDFGMMISQREIEGMENLAANEPEFAENLKIEDFRDAFFKKYKSEFGFVLKNRKIFVDDIRVRGVGHATCDLEAGDISQEEQKTPPEIETTKTYFKNHGWMDTPIHHLNNLSANSEPINGPSIIMNGNSTVVIEPNCSANITKSGNILINVDKLEKKLSDSDLCDPIQLSIFSHRFMSIAEQMGRRLQRTSVSTNIKERLDFSCALFGPDGGLVSNAPHIPVHLGAMQQAVRFQIKRVELGELQINKGDVILSNHPIAGGSHLPDLTVITPVFAKNSDSEIVFFVANRGHHADIGGSTPGSMPSNSTSLNEEGAQFISFKIVNQGIYQETNLIEMFNKPAEQENCVGSRNLADNLADLNAQIAANQRGIELVLELMEEYSKKHVQNYMRFIQEQAEKSVRALLKSQPSSTLFAEDFLDDGTKIRLKVAIDQESGSAVFDFSGTDQQSVGNLNAPIAVTYSAVIYCMRCLVEYDIPLNQGCLSPIEIILPKNSILNPSLDAAVVGGNVLTSQRVVDVILKAFQKCAASQGCMNNITFGNENFGYYETVCGGIGAGNNYNGEDGTHSHMTNTRITDVEIIESRYPVIVTSFYLRENSGGDGRFRGGKGVVRKLKFRKPINLSILTERRVYAPYGMNGGGPGLKGQNFVVKNGEKWRLPSKASIKMGANDEFWLFTPGGGGFGFAHR